MLPNKRSKIIVLMSVFLLLFAVGAGCSKDDEASTPKKEENQQEQSDKKANNEKENQVTRVDFDLADDEQVATYDEKTITTLQLENYTAIQTFFNPGIPAYIKGNQEMVAQLIKRYAAEQILSAKAKEKDTTANEVNTFYSNMKEQAGDEKEFNRTLQELKLTEGQLKDFIKTNILMEDYLESQATEEKMKSLYEANQDLFTIVTLRHILIDTRGKTEAEAEKARKQAQELAERIRKGEDFAKLAKEYSADPGSKDNGGMYENASVSNWVPEFKNAALTLEIGKVSDPVKTEYGYHVIKVEKREVLPYAEVKTEVKSLTVNEIFKDFMDKDIEKLVKIIKVPAVK